MTRPKVVMKQSGLIAARLRQRDAIMKERHLILPVRKKVIAILDGFPDAVGSGNHRRGSQQQHKQKTSNVSHTLSFPSGSLV
jgi:hypothetical protein